MKIKLKGGKMERKTIGIAAFLVVALLGVGFVSAYGFGNDMSKETRDAVQNALDSGDYSTWKSLMESQITEERFNEMKAKHQERAEFRALMREARESGNYSAIQELKEEFGSGKGMHKENMNSGECPFANK